MITEYFVFQLGRLNQPYDIIKPEKFVISLKANFFFNDVPENLKKYEELFNISPLFYKV